MLKHSLGELIISFFRNYLAAQKGCSENTISSYSDCIRLLLQYCGECLNKTIDQLSMEEISDKIILEFLDHLERVRHNKPQSRNTRLAAIRSFFRFLALQEPELVSVCERVCAITFKKTTKSVIEPLLDNEVAAFLEAVDQTTFKGVRDYAVLLLLYNTGARVQEIIDLKWADVRFENPYFVKLTGKGRKERIVPLWDKTILALTHYLEWTQKLKVHHERIFLNKHNEPITRFGIRTIIQKYAEIVRTTSTDLCQHPVSPHTFRHTTALHMIQSGVDVNVVKDFLGHAHINTTCQYITINLEMKRQAIEECEKKVTIIKGKNEKAKWHDNDVMDYLKKISKESVLCDVRA